jgi:hypothetical protein
MGLFTNLFCILTGFGVGVYVHKNCHFEKIVIKPLTPIIKNPEFSYPTGWKTDEEKNKD